MDELPDAMCVSCNMRFKIMHGMDKSIDAMYAILTACIHLVLGMRCKMLLLDPEATPSHEALGDLWHLGDGRDGGSNSGSNDGSNDGSNAASMVVAVMVAMRYP